MLKNCLQKSKDFFIAPYADKKMDLDFLRGAWLPFLINSMTKGSSKPLEQQGGLNPQHMTAAVILLTLSNVIVKAQSMMFVFQKNRSANLKIACFLMICGYDVLANYLLAKQDFRNLFPKPSHDVEHSSWIFLGILNATYMLFAAVSHYQEQQEIKQQQAELATVLSTQAHKDNLPPAPSFYINTLNNTQLPVKFLCGVSTFFFTIMACEKYGAKLQLPMSSLTYATAMALTQFVYNKLKDETNNPLILYSFIAGIVEGLSYFSGIKWLPEEMHTALKGLIIATTTSASLLIGGHVAFALIPRNKADNHDQEKSTKDYGTDSNIDCLSP